MAVTLTPVETLNIGIIGVGGEGCRMVRFLEREASGYENVSVVMWDSCRHTIAALESTVMQSRIMGANIAHGLGCVGQYELGRSIFLDEQEHCRHWIADKDVIFVAGALGGGFSGGFFPEFAKLAKQANVSMVAYALMPFSFEGRKRMESSKQVLGKLREHCMAVTTLEGDDYLAYIDEAGYAQLAVEQMRKECSAAMAAMTVLLLEKGLYGFDLSTLHSVFDLDVSKTLLLSAEADDEAEGVELAVDTLIERIDQKLPDKELKIDRVLISVVGGKKLAAGSINQLNLEISDRLGQSGKTFFAACVVPEIAGLRIMVYVSIHLGKQFEWIDLSGEPSNTASAVHKQSRKVSRKKSKQRKSGKKGSSQEDVPQGLFDTILNESNRGYFDETAANSWNGIDLDVPTYIRRGIRVKI